MEDPQRQTPHAPPADCPCLLLPCCCSHLHGSHARLLQTGTARAAAPPHLNQQLPWLSQKGWQGQLWPDCPAQTYCCWQQCQQQWAFPCVLHQPRSCCACQAACSGAQPSCCHSAPLHCRLAGCCAQSPGSHSQRPAHCQTRRCCCPLRPCRCPLQQLLQPPLPPQPGAQAWLLHLAGCALQQLCRQRAPPPESAPQAVDPQVPSLAMTLG